MNGNSTFSNAYNDDPTSTLVAVDTSVVNMSQTIFTNLSSLSVSPLFNFQELILYSDGVTVSGFDKTLFALSNGEYIFSGLKISKGKMTWSNLQDAFMVNAIVFDVAQADLSLLSSSVDGIYSNYSSPVIYIDNDPTANQQQTLLLNGSRFTNNVANISAGVLLSVNTNVTVDNCLFSGNAALLGDGGALYLSCDKSMSIPCTYTVSNSVFSNNTAGVDGGAIKYDYYTPDIHLNNSFFNNKATYGPSVASYPAQLQFINQKRDLQMLNTSQVQKLGLPKTAVVFNMTTPLVSGSLITQGITLKLQDQNGTSIVTDNSSVAEMYSLNSNVTVMKSKSVQAVNGQFLFNDVIVVGPPGSIILLQITADSINPFMLSAAYPDLSFSSVYVQAYLRYCQAGEYQTTD